MGGMINMVNDWIKTRLTKEHPQTGKHTPMTGPEFNKFISERDYPSSIEEEDRELYFKRKHQTGGI